MSPSQNSLTTVDPVHLMNTFRMAEVFVLVVAMFWVFDLTRAYFASRKKD